jgi:hypothetical protein
MRLAWSCLNLRQKRNKERIDPMGAKSRRASKTMCGLLWAGVYDGPEESQSRICPSSIRHGQQQLQQQLQLAWMNLDRQRFNLNMHMMNIFFLTQLHFNYEE